MSKNRTSRFYTDYHCRKHRSRNIDWNFFMLTIFQVIG